MLALTQGDPAGVGPEILLRILSDEGVGRAWRPVLVLERAAADALRGVLPGVPWRRLRFVRSPADLDGADPGVVPVIDPVARDPVARDPIARERPVVPGRPRRDDARGALAALDLGVQLVRGGAADALVTAPVSKAVVARHLLPGFRGHTDYLAAKAGLERYGRDYLMAFLAPDLKVALMTTHLPLRGALDAVRRTAVLEALRCLARHAGGRIAVAGLNPHAGEEGLLGSEDDAEVRPAIEAARSEGIDARGPESPDSVFARARRGEFDWVLALYHDQGLIAVKTAAFGAATNWTLGLPYLRTSVDHGTAYAVAGRGEADVAPLRAVVETTLRLLAERARVESARPGETGRRRPFGT